MEDGWTIRPPTPPVVEPAANNDDFAIEVNTTLLQVCFDLHFITVISVIIPCELTKRPAFEMLLLPEYISNDIL